MKFALKPILIGTAAGLVVGLTLFCLVASATFGASDNAYIFRVLFPYAGAVEPSTRSWVILSLFVLQYPLYGGLLGIASNQVRHRLLILVAILTLIVGGHFAAVRSAHRADAIWVESQAWE